MVINKKAIDALRTMASVGLVNLDGWIAQLRTFDNETGDIDKYVVIRCKSKEGYTPLSELGSVTKGYITKHDLGKCVKDGLLSKETLMTGYNEKKIAVRSVKGRVPTYEISSAIDIEDLYALFDSGESITPNQKPADEMVPEFAMEGEVE